MLLGEEKPPIPDHAESSAFGRTQRSRARLVWAANPPWSHGAQHHIRFARRAPLAAVRASIRHRRRRPSLLITASARRLEQGRSWAAARACRGHRRDAEFPARLAHA